MSDHQRVLSLIAQVPQILDAAWLLKHHNLIEEKPADVVTRFVEKHPEINAYLSKAEAK